MKIKDFDNASKLPRLQAIIVESILLSCNDGSSFNNLVLILQRKLFPSSSSPRPSHHMIKKHLFHLINYDLIKYSGQKQKYYLQDEGFDLLNWIKKEKIKLDVDIKDILITIE
ncbi:MAG: hypothetical protein ACTHME_00685 [Candidatus Nitrosocosmicus sp.]